MDGLRAISLPLPCRLLARGVVGSCRRHPPVACGRVFARLDAGSRRPGAADLRHSYRATKESVLFQLVAASPTAPTLAGFAHFLARQFLFALPMLFAVTVADNATTRSGQRARVLALSAAVLLGAIVYGLAFFIPNRRTFSRRRRSP